MSNGMNNGANLADIADPYLSFLPPHLPSVTLSSLLPSPLLSSPLLSSLSSQVPDLPGRPVCLKGCGYSEGTDDGLQRCARGTECRGAHESQVGVT